MKDKNKSNKTKDIKTKKRVKTTEKTIGKFTLFGSILAGISFLAIIITIPIVTIVGISNNSYGNYTDSAYKKDTIRLESLLTKHESDAYYVFIYKSDCPACDDLEQDVLKYIKKGPRPLYLLDGDKYEDYLIQVDYESQTIMANYEVNNWEDLRVAQFPCLLLVSNGEIIAHNIGETSIYNQLKMR